MVSLKDPLGKGDSPLQVWARAPGLTHIWSPSVRCDIVPVNVHERMHVHIHDALSDWRNSTWRDSRGRDLWWRIVSRN
jgi:hypothetical protein